MQPIDHYVVALLSLFAEKPERVVLWWRDRPITAAEFSRSITTAALVLRREGIDATSKVTFLTTGNSPEMLVVRYAANLLGATVLHPQSINAVNALDEVAVGTQAELLAECGTSLLVVDARNVERARAIAARIGSPLKLAAFSGGEPGLVDLSTAPPGEAEASFDVTSAVTGTSAMVTYTSGSTGIPKGASRPFSAIFSMVSRSKAALEKHTMLITVPLGQAAASLVDAALAGEGSVVLHEGFDATRVLDAVAKHRVTRLYVATPQLYQLVDHPARATTDTSSIRQLVYTGCTASPRRLAHAVEAFGPVLIQMYGMTEAWAISVLPPPDHFQPKLLTTVGRPLPGVQVAIRDPHTGEDLPRGQTGEVCVCSPYIMDGYWRNPELTARALRAGWLHTGDLGYLDDEGYLHLVDRLGSMIKTRGIKVYPAAVENALLTHPAVAHAAVYGVADADEVEHVHAAVVPYAGAAVDVNALREHVERALTAGHAPVAISILAELPLLESGKPDKRRLRFEAEVAAGRQQPGTPTR
ncbi:AMP-binding protein [Pendulispora brunnea]|uniref:AMP-binding protein n=1 Tax=Pendulispora brunnea TaxID=2905690 RepID=A0ABZ2KPF2_9BACT